MGVEVWTDYFQQFVACFNERYTAEYCYIKLIINQTQILLKTLQELPGQILLVEALKQSVRFLQVLGR